MVCNDDEPQSCPSKGLFSVDLFLRLTLSVRSKLNNSRTRRAKERKKDTGDWFTSVKRRRAGFTRCSAVSSVFVWGCLCPNS